MTNTIAFWRRRNWPHHLVWSQAFALVVTGSILWAGKPATAAPAAPRELWARDFGGAAAEADSSIVDDAGNTVITGASSGSGSGFINVLIVKFDTTGKRVWSAVYSSPGSQVDWGKAVATDGAGNVYVLARLSSGRNGINRDVALLKYDLEGRLAWERTLVSEEDELLSGLAVSETGEVYFGVVIGPYATQETLLRKYSPDGALVWQRALAPSGQLRYLRIELDAAGNITVPYATPAEFGGVPGLITLTSAGDTLSAITFPRFTRQTIQLAFGVAGEIFLAGSVKVGASADLYLARLNEAGGVIWELQYDGGQNEAEVDPHLVVKDQALYVAGLRLAGPNDELGIYALRLTQAGAISYAVSAGQIGLETAVSDLSVSNDGHLYVIGDTYDLPNRPNVIDDGWSTWQFTPTGELVWTNLYNPTKRGEYTQAIHLDSAGNVYAVGNTQKGIGLIKYPPAGTATMLAHSSAAASTIVGGQSVTVTLTLTEAPTRPVTVKLRCTNPLLRVPRKVKFSSGVASIQFQATSRRARVAQRALIVAETPTDRALVQIALTP